MGRWKALVLTVLLAWVGLMPSGATSATAAAAPTRAAPTAATGFMLPVPPPPQVLTPFAPPPTRYGAGHRGVDLAAEVGAVISAAGPGRVVFAGDLAGRGVVSIEHEGGLRTTYEPVTAAVTAGPADRQAAGRARRLCPGELPALGRPAARRRLPGPAGPASAVGGPAVAVGGPEVPQG